MLEIEDSKFNTRRQKCANSINRSNVQDELVNESPQNNINFKEFKERNLITVKDNVVKVKSDQENTFNIRSLEIKEKTNNLKISQSKSYGQQIKAKNDEMLKEPDLFNQSTHTQRNSDLFRKKNLATTTSNKKGNS